MGLGRVGKVMSIICASFAVIKRSCDSAYFGSIHKDQMEEQKMKGEQELLNEDDGPQLISSNNSVLTLILISFCVSGQGHTAS